jgi:predicted ATPase
VIERVVIQNFRSIRDLVVELSPFSVLVGPNGAGKTNFVQALTLLGQMIDVGSTDPIRNAGWSEVVWRGEASAETMTLGATLDRRMMRTTVVPGEPATREPVHVRIALAVTVRGDPEHVEVVEERIEVRDGGDGALLARVVDDGSEEPVVEIPDPARLAALPGMPRHLSGASGLHHAGNEEERRRFLRVFGAHSPWRFLVRGPLLVFRFRFDATGLRADSPADGRAVLDLTGNNLAAEIERMRGTGAEPSARFQDLLTALQGVYDRIVDVRPVRVRPGRLTLQFEERGIRVPLDQSAVSDGVLHALALLVAIFTDGQGVLALEEPENAIHPWAARALVRLAQQERRRQILLTTHSETVVSAIVDPRALYVVEHGDRGTTIQRAADRATSLDVVLRETGQRLGDVWIDGSLGGVPEGRS